MENEELEDSSLHEAVRYGDLEDVRQALKQGDSPNQIGIYQWNPLHEAACNGDTEIVKLLLKYGGDPNKADLLRGSSAVHYAASNSHYTVLKLLLKAGGLYSTKNSDGESCLDVAQGFECQKILREQRDKHLILPNQKEELKEAVLLDTRANDSNNNNDGLSDTTSINSVISDLDTISVASSSSSRPHSRAWGKDRVLGIKELQLGHVQLSFEYNAKKRTFKIRVWQVTDLLLPPTDTSMINSVYVKSYLQPDKRKDTKRKTEEVKTDQIDFKEIKKKGQEHIVNFQPACFRFSRVLEYEGVTKETIDSRVVEVEVCIVQKYTRKSFVVATWNVPMKVAVKKLVKEKFPLKPMLSTSLPENMKVYNANEMDIQFSRNYRSNPNLQRSSSSRSHWAVPYPDQRALSDTNLQKVTVDSFSKSSSSSIEIKVPNDEDDDLQMALQQIAVMERDEKIREFTEVSVPNSIQDDEDGLDICVHRDPIKVAEVQIHVPKPDPATTTVQPQVKPDSSPPKHSTKKKSSFLSSKAKEKSALREKANRTLKAGPQFSKLDDEEASIGLPSRTASPVWDYYTDPLSFDKDIDMSTVDVEAPAGQVTLPMAIGFDLPETHRIPSFRREETVDVETARHSHRQKSEMTKKKYSFRK